MSDAMTNALVVMGAGIVMAFACAWVNANAGQNRWLRLVTYCGLWIALGVSGFGFVHVIGAAT